MFPFKYISVLLLFVCICVVSVAQNRGKVDLRSEDLIKPNQRTLYTGYDNHISIIEDGVIKNDLKIVAADSVIIIDSASSNIIRVTSLGKVSLFISSREKGDTVKKIVYTCEELPLPTPLISEKTGGDISLKEIFSAGNIKSINKTDLKELPAFKIESFTLAVFTGMGMEYYKSASDRFSTEQLSGFMKMKPGQKFLIQDIIIKYENKETAKLPTLQFRLKKGE